MQQRTAPSLDNGLRGLLSISPDQGLSWVFIEDELHIPLATYSPCVYLDILVTYTIYLTQGLYLGFIRLQIRDIVVL